MKGYRDLQSPKSDFNLQISKFPKTEYPIFKARPTVAVTEL